MARVEWRDGALDADAEATHAAYAAMGLGGPEGCACDHCHNWMAARAGACPREVCDLISRLGIDPGKESEAAWTHRSEDGLHHYMGWFRFVGSLLAGGSPPSSATGTSRIQRRTAITPTFEVGFDAESTMPRRKPLGRRGTVEVRFLAAVPWVCDRREPREPSEVVVNRQSAAAILRAIRARKPTSALRRLMRGERRSARPQ